MNLRKLVNCNFRNPAMVGLSALALSTFAISAKADLITNGDFSANTGVGQFDFSTTVTGWSNPGPAYNFLCDSTTNDCGTGNAGAVSIASDTGTNNPGDPFYAALDGNFGVGPIQQTVSGLVVGETYSLSFWWGGAQQSGFTGASMDQLTASLGAQSFTTGTLNVPEQGFTGWNQETFTFTATATSEVLSFLASSPGNEAPPFALIEDVSLNPTPEVGSFILLVTLLGMAAVLSRFRSRKPLKG